MPANTSYAESDLQRGAIFAFDPVDGLFKAVKVNAAGELVTTAGGGGGGDVRVKDATLAQFLAVDASGRITVLGSGTFITDPTDRAARDLGRVRIWDGVDVATVNALGALDVSVPDPTHVDGKGTAGVPSGGVLSVQGVASGMVLPVSDGGGVLSVDDNAATLSVDDGAGSLTVDGTVGVSGNVNSKPYPVAAADILTGRAVRLNTVTAVAIITIPAGRTWYGNVSMTVLATGAVAATKLTADVRTAGTNVTPAVGTQMLEIITHHGSTTADFKGLTSGDFYVVAPVGNAVTLDLKLDTASANFEAVATARGVLL